MASISSMENETITGEEEDMELGISSLDWLTSFSSLPRIGECLVVPVFVKSACLDCNYCNYLILQTMLIGECRLPPAPPIDLLAEAF